MFKTYNDLYQAICDLGDGDEGQDVLEDYLSALLVVALRVADRPSLPIPQFFQLLVDAFQEPMPESVPPPPEPPKRGFEEDTFGYWHWFIFTQIESLVSLRKSDVLKDSLSAFGAYTPESGTWFNTDTFAYLECAATASFYNHDDPVLVQDGDVITWNEFSDFLEMGRYYE